MAGPAATSAKWFCTHTFNNPAKPEQDYSSAVTLHVCTCHRSNRILLNRICSLCSVILSGLITEQFIYVGVIEALRKCVGKGQCGPSHSILEPSVYVPSDLICCIVDGIFGDIM